MQPTSIYKTFETERLWLKPMDETDASFLLQIVNSPKWLQFIGDRNLHTEEAAAAYIKEKVTSQLERLGYGNNVVIQKKDNMPVGVCGLYDRPGLPIIDIGFAFLENFEGKGYGYEAASSLLKGAKENFGLDKVCAITSMENQASQKLLLKLGLEYIKMIKLENDKEEMLYYEKAL